MTQEDQKLINWIKSNISRETLLPLSFDIVEEQKDDVYARMGEPNEVSDIIERMIVEEGLVIYDGAVAQIVLAMLGGQGNIELASVPIETYWEGQVGDLNNIRAGYPINEFIYDPDNPESVSSNLSEKGKRGFIFRIINANGHYNTEDPLDGKTLFEGFPNWPTVHWEDWKPVAGENAWVAMAALHIYHNKYYDASTQSYKNDNNAIELQLAEELARAALILQAENGGIRMAPLGTYRNPADCATPEEEEGAWWYHQISGENNISWYSAFRMLYEVTKKEVYKKAMEDIEFYFQESFNDRENYFYQGMHFINGAWKPNDEHFALDVQTWALTAFGPEKIDSWFGEGTSFAIWRTAKSLSGVHDAEGNLLGVGYIHEHDRLSVEWTAGAIFAARRLSHYYETINDEWSYKARYDAFTMRRGVEVLRSELSDTCAAYSYSSKRGWIPFGWFSHDPEVLSLSSTGWILFVDSHYNPFFLPHKQNKEVKQFARTVYEEIGF